MTRTVLAGVGPAAFGADVVLDLGSTHPSTAGGLQLRLVLDDDVVVSAEPVVGFMHRGAEKLFEVRDYRQVVVLADRHDWLSSFGSELGVVLAVERMLGLVLPERAAWLRVLFAELHRVLHHLSFAPASLGSTLGEREAVQGLLEEATGGRLHVGSNRVGGLHEDVPAGWTGRVRAVVGQLRPAAGQLLDRARQDLPEGVGVLSQAAARGYGASGPVARGSGLGLDLRRDDPYLVYPELQAFRVVLGTGGDTRARFLCLLEQVLVALDVVQECLDRLPSGAVSVKLPKTVKAPEGAAYTWTENPSGAMGWYLVSRGQKTPYRLAMRTPSFAHVSALPALLPGTRLADVPSVLASLFFVVGDVDK